MQRGILYYWRVSLAYLYSVIEMNLMLKVKMVE